MKCKSLGVSVSTLMLLAVQPSTTAVSASQVAGTNKESLPTILIAVDCSPSIADDTGEVRRHWRIVGDILRKNDVNAQVGIIKFASRWEEVFAGEAKDLPTNLGFAIQQRSRSDIREAVRGILAARHKLTPTRKNKTIGFIISDFWHQDEPITQKKIAGVAEIDSVYLRVIGYATHRIVDLFPQNCRAVSEQEMAAVLEAFVKQQADAPSRPVIPLLMLIVMVALVTVLIIRMRRRREFAIDKKGEGVVERPLPIRIESQFEHKHLVNVFDLNSSSVSVGVNGEVRLPEFTGTSILLCRGKNNHIDIINAGETVFYLDGRVLRPGNQLKSRKSGVIEIPYQRDGKKAKATIRFAGMIK